MPLFDLECQACQHRWEDMVKEGVIPPCPECAATTVEKLLTISVAIPKYVPKPGTTLELHTERTSAGKVKVHGYTEKPIKKP